MKFRIRYADQIVGMFVLLAIASLAGILIFMGINQRWFAKDYYFNSRFLSGEGLNVGMTITLKGFPIGKVSAISLNEQNQVDVEFYIMDTYYEKVKQNSILELATNPLGLGGGLLFHPGKNEGEPLPEFSFIPSLSLPEGKELVVKGLVEISSREDAINSLLGKVEPVLVNVNQTLLSVNTLIMTMNETLEGNHKGPLGKILADAENMTEQLNTLLADTSRIIAETTDKINELLNDLQYISDNVGATTAALRDPTGLIPKLLDPKGSIKTFLDDDNMLYAQIEEILKGVDETIEQFKDFSEFISSTSPQISGLLEDSRDALDQGKDVLEGIKNNPLIRGGIPKQMEQPTTFQSYRDEDF
ncbi:MAG: hypothetical protein DRP87_06860 [Spirochaetes bacterium]|nr:MAG: hypothetical protein DRP87_06860 [Spirochaetota bacterium]